MKTKIVQLQNEHGIHTRAGAQIVECASGFISDITLSFANQTIDAKRIMQLLTLGAKSGDEVCIAANGEDEDMAIEVLGQLLADELI